MKNTLNYITKSILICLGAICLGSILIILIYSLPTSKMKDNVLASLDTFEKEDTYPIIVDKYESTQLDNFTDAIILGEATYDGKENIIDKAMHVYRYISTSPINNLSEPLKNNNNFQKISYGRYWHGILIPIKLLLIFFSYSDIRMLNYFLQFFITIYLIYLMNKKNLCNYIIPFGVGLVFISPFINGLSIQFSTVFYISSISSIIILKFNDKLNTKKYYPYLFLIIGILVCFFDLLTYPIFSLTLPLIFYYLLNKKENAKDLFTSLIIFCFSWLFGYFIMWLGKWIIGSVLCQENFIKDAFEQAKFRTSEIQEMDRFKAIETILEIFRKKAYNALMIFTTLYFIIRMYKKGLKFNKKIFFEAFPFIIILVIPLIWYFILSNHSIIHIWFTSKSLSTSVFCYFIILETIVLKPNNKKKK